MDGEVIRAMREYAFANDGNTTIEAAFECVVSKHDLTLKLASIVGDPNNPSKRSAFQFDTGSVPYTPDSYDANGMREIHAGDNFLAAIANRPRLQGRIKFDGQEPRDIGGLVTGYFSRGNFANVMTANFTQWSAVGLTMWSRKQQASNFSKDTLDSLRTNHKLNGVATLKYLFPVVIEVRNGVGTYEIVIDESSAVAAVIDGCGGRDPVVDASLRARFGVAALSSAGASSVGSPSKVANAYSESTTTNAGATNASKAVAVHTGASLESASFDCRNASSPAETAICAHPQLSDLDGRMALAYKQLLRHDPLVRLGQRDWVGQRNKCGSNVGCLTSSYKNRLKEIQEIQSESNKLDTRIPQ